MERSYLPAISDYISRPRIDALLNRGLEHSLVLVMAGPGYGKTLSLAHFLKDLDVRLVWLRASNHRTKPAEFWEDFVRAVARELPEYAKQLEALEFPSDSGSLEQFRQLSAKAAGAGNRLVFVLDRYELLIDEGIVRLVDNLIDADLQNFTLVVLCNAILPFAKTLPATGLFRISDVDLAFDKEETRKMFAHYGINTKPDYIEKTIRATGGWPLSLRLICESNPQNPEVFSSKSAMQLSADLHEQHYFRDYSEDVKTRLICLSILPYFSMEMVRLGMEKNASELYNLLMRHPFVSFDYSTNLFEFQPVYRDFLKQKQTLVSLDARMEMQAFAGRWFIEHDHMQDAMDCFWETGDYDGFLEVLYRWPKTLRKSSITNKVLQRLLQVPRSYADQQPAVDFGIAFMFLATGDVVQAKKRLLALAEKLETGPATEERRLFLGDIYAALSDIGIYQNEDTALAWIQKAYALIPNGSRIHEPVLLAIGNNSVFYMPNNEAGQLERMVEYMFAYAPYADKVKNGCGYGYEYLFAGEAAYYREDMDTASTMFNSAMMKASQKEQHDVVCNALLGLGHIEFYYANYKNVLALLKQVEDYTEENNLTGLYELRDCSTAWFYMQLGDLDQVPAWFGEIIPGPDEMLISLGRNRLAIAYYLFAKGDLIKAQAVILQLEAQLENQGRWAEKLILCMLKALCHLSKGEGEAFEKAFRRAYNMVYRNHIKIALAAYGKEMMAAIDQIKKRDAKGYDIEWLDEVYKDALSYAKRLQAMKLAHGGAASSRTRYSTDLTPREDETLRHLAKGLSQEEIGKLMGISTNAVKKHITKIYNKLGAINRADAIHIATINGLVDVVNN